MKSLRIVWLIFVGACAGMAAEEQIVAEDTINAPVASVWSAWTTSEGLRAWVAPHADIDLRLGGLMRTNYNPKGALGDAGTIANRILSYEPGRMLSIQVASAPSDFPFRDIMGSMWTVLTLEAVSPTQTKVRIVGLGFGSDPASLKMKEFFTAGNAFTLAQLKKHLEAGR